MTKKFTEEEYQKIVNFFDNLDEKYYMGLLSSDLVDEVFKKFSRDYDYELYWKEIVAIMNPITRDEAHEKFVEKEKKYLWKYKKTDMDGETRYLAERRRLIIPVIGGEFFNPFTEKEVIDSGFSLFTEKEIIEAGYNPDMYEKKEVE